MSTQTSCPNAASLQELLAGTLPETVQAALTGHVETCADCQQKLEQLSAEPGLGSGLFRQMADERLNQEAGLRQALDELQDEAESTPNVTRQFKEGDLSLDFLSPSEKPGHLGKLGHYEVLEVIGRGGMGIVLKAFDESLHRVVAIKVMAPELAANATARKRFVREAQAAAAIRNDHVIGIHAVEEAYQLPYLVMEYISGKSLQERLDETGPLQLKEILRIGMQTATGLAAAHAQGLVHRDIKPANILMENGVERVKITDFGLARAVDDASISQSGIVAGTPQFMAPEQARGEHLDHRADLFSLGSMLYAMCTGRAPFRAHNTVAVLRRVSDDQVRPIREINAEIPDWLVAIVEKLHAKEPADRYQTAAEVAEVLGQHLAQLQQPVPRVAGAEAPRGVAGAEALQRVAGAEALRSPGKAPSRVAAPAGASKTQPRPPTAVGVPLLAGKQWHTGRWVAAAAVLLVLIGSLAVTEATGVTKVTEFVATILEIRTPEGTLIVEVNDPDVKVTIEGDGGLVITGAGPQEVRLKPGSYKVEASKDGKPVKTEVVTITRNGKQVVTVQIEGPPAGTAGQAEKQPFVVLGGKGVAERKFDTLAEAVQNASDGDAIEIRGNGPFVSQPISIQRTALTIKAGDGFRPVIKLSPEGEQRDVALLTTNAALVLEGLELYRAPREDQKGRVLDAMQAPLRAANCRFRASMGVIHAPVCVFRNCEFLAENAQVAAMYIPGARVTFENCLHRTTGGAIGIGYDDAALRDVSIQIRGSTFVSRYTSLHLPLRGPLPVPSDPPAASKPFRLEVSGSIFDAPNVLDFHQEPKFLEKAAVLEPAQAEAALLSLLEWRGERNLFAAGSTAVLWYADGKQQPPRGPKNLEEWKRFWGAAETDSLEGTLRFQGGNLLSRPEAALDQLTPQDFRLRPDSAGYRAGKDGKDLGADVDLVGPGAAYERWKQTPEYQQWLKDTGQLRAEVPKAEPKAFVVLGGKGVEVRRYDTLADAVQGASDGDTIEIRGNGPFVTQPISIKQTLTIRAGEGFRPVIKANPEEQQGKNLLNTNAPLVLEGLDFQWVEAKAFDPTDGRLSCLVVTSGPTSRLHVANCRFLMNRRTGPHDGMLCIGGWGMAICRLRNCQFLVGGSLNFVGIPQSEVTVENCLLIGGVALPLTHAEPMRVVMKRNTSLGSHSLTLSLGNKIDPPGEKDSRPLQWETSANILDGQVQFGQFADYLAKEKALSAREAEQLLTRLIDWRENRNLYLLPEDRDLLRLIAAMTPGQATLLPPTAPLNTLADWKRFWGMAEPDSLRGQARFQGGDLIAKAGRTPELLAPDDFRLRPDSTGYRAGKDGKDLGADVDLVGPGAAYERWKQTPEYQQWLKETGQVRDSKQ